MTIIHKACQCVAAARACYDSYLKKKLFGTLHFDYIEISLLLKIYKKKDLEFSKKIAL